MRWFSTLQKDNPFLNLHLPFSLGQRSQPKRLHVEYVIKKPVSFKLSLHSRTFPAFPPANYPHLLTFKMDYTQLSLLYITGNYGECREIL